MNGMSTIKAIRERLRLTQAGLAAELGCTQGNVWQMEQGEGDGVSPRMAKRLVSIARRKGMRLSLDQVYGLKPLPEAKATEAKAA